MSDSDQSKSSSENSVRLDLGLSSFIDGAKQQLDQETKPIATLAEVLKQSEQTQSEAPAELSSLISKAEIASSHNQEKKSENNYKQLADQSSWNELSKLCESALTANEKDFEARLWWIKAQRSQNAIPASILATSIDSASQEFIKDSNALASREDLRKLASELLVDISSSLKSEFDLEIAQSLLERAKTLGFAEKKDSPVKEQAEFSENPWPGFVIQPRKEPASTSEGYSRKRAIYSRLILLLFLCASGIFIYLKWFSSSNLEGQYLAFAFPAEDSLSPSLLSPAAEPVSGLSHLDAVYYDMNSSSAGNATQVSALSAGALTQSTTLQNTPVQSSQQQASIIQPPVPQLPIAVDQQPVRQLPTSRDVARSQSQGSQGQKETVNTTYPVERREYPADDKFETRQQPENEIPEIDFPPFRSNTKRNDPRDSRDSGGPREPLYIVIARTKIMEEPSYWAHSLGDLYEGDKIEVHDRLGKWLRIRTRKGREGYILSQDAERY